MHKPAQTSSLALAVALVAGGWSIPTFAQEGAVEASDGATIIVTGKSLSVIPGWHVTVRQSASVPVERLTE